MSRYIGKALVWAGWKLSDFADWLGSKANDVVLLGQEMGGAS